MRFLVDENQAPIVTSLLRDAGHDAVHVRELGLAGALDDELLDVARRNDRVVLSADTDFGELLARTNAARPSVILLRRQRGRRAADVVALVLANLASFEAELADGAVVVLDDDRVRIRRLPFWER